MVRCSYYSLVLAKQIAKCISSWTCFRITDETKAVHIALRECTIGRVSVDFVLQVPEQEQFWTRLYQLQPQEGSISFEVNFDFRFIDTVAQPYKAASEEKRLRNDYLWISLSLFKNAKILITSHLGKHGVETLPIEARLMTIFFYFPITVKFPPC